MSDQSPVTVKLTIRSARRVSSQLTDAIAASTRLYGPDFSTLDLTDLKVMLDHAVAADEAVESALAQQGAPA